MFSSLKKVEGACVPAPRDSGSNRCLQYWTVPDWSAAAASAAGVVIAAPQPEVNQGAAYQTVSSQAPPLGPSVSSTVSGSACRPEGHMHPLGGQTCLWPVPDWAAARESAAKAVPLATPSIDFDSTTVIAAMGDVLAAAHQFTSTLWPDLQASPSSSADVLAQQEVAILEATQLLQEMTEEDVVLEQQAAMANDAADLAATSLESALVEPSSANVATIMDSTVEHDICKICFVAAADVVFVPCGHLGFCMQCSKHLSSCPICRCRVDLKQRAFRV